jgi:hypothetical protein
MHNVARLDSLYGSQKRWDHRLVVAKAVPVCPKNDDTDVVARDVLLVLHPLISGYQHFKLRGRSRQKVAIREATPPTLRH